MFNCFITTEKNKEETFLIICDEYQLIDLCILFPFICLLFVAVVPVFFFSMAGGELFQRIQDRQDGGPFTERGNLIVGTSKRFFVTFVRFNEFDDVELKICKHPKH